MRRPRVMRSLSVWLTVCVWACDRPGPPPADTAADTAVPAPDLPPPWVDELGPLLVVPSDSEGTAVVVFPQSPSSQLLASAPITLLATSGDTARARATLASPDAQACEGARTIRIRGDSASSWSVGLRARSVAPIAMDSIEALSSTDSARIAVDLARLASSLPLATGSRFSGLPFVVLSARRFNASGLETVVAQLARRVPQEASPLQEHTFIVADRATPGESYRIGYHMRSEGTEDTVDHYEVLSAIRSGPAVFLLVAIDRDSQTVYEILERTGPGSWRVRWERTLAC